MKKFFLILFILPTILACNFLSQGFGVTTPTPQLPTPKPLESATRTPLPDEPTLPPEPSPTPFVLQLEQINPLPTRCSLSPFGLAAEKIIEVAYVPSGFCFNGEIDTFEINDHFYVVQSLGDEAAFFITDATDPQNPNVVGAWQWNDYTYTADVKAFKQGDRRFIVLSLEPIIKLCGVTVVEVTDPANPILIGRYDGVNTNAPDEWCDTHTSEVSADANGNGAFIYASALDTADLRILDIHNLSHVTEINHYTDPDANNSTTFVHDTTIVRDRVYVAYWSAGVVILDRALLESGGEVKPLNPPNSIAPDGLQIHHSYPTEDDNFLFVEDEVNYDGKRSQLRLYDIRDLDHPTEVLAIKLEEPYSSPHNLLIVGDLLYVGWYTDGVRVFQFDVNDPEKPTVEPYAFKVTRIKKTEGVFGSDIFDSIYGVRLHDCEIDGQTMTCIFASDLTRGLLILAIEPPS
jgi:hypothetical protein